MEICSYDFCHNERNRQVIPATGAHTYDNDCDDVCNHCGTYRPVPDHVYDHPCDVDCNVCGAIREVGPHVYDNECDPTCRECGAIREVEPHPYEVEILNPPTCGLDGLCVYTCPYCWDTYTETIPATGEHTYDNVCDPDCNECYAIRWVEGHAYDNDCDDVCNYCGTYRPVPDHVYDHPCDADCNVCGAIREVGPHVYDNECDPTCRECGAIREVEPHPYEVEILNPPTCGLDGLCVYTCPYCWDTYTETIPATGEHTYDNVCDPDCNECYAIRWVEGHAYDNDCDDVCNYCGTYRPVPDHVYDHPCDADCNVCGATREVGPHVYDNECDPTCRECGAIREVPDHIYDNTCDTDCNVCYAVREITHTYSDNELVCDVCGDIRSIESIEITSRPRKTRYVLEQDELNLQGGVLTVHYSDGTNRKVDLIDTAVRGFDNTVEGTCVLTVFYGDHTATFTVQIVAPNSHIPGDLNGDGKVNVRDLGMLQQHLNGWDVEIIPEAADVTADGKVNVRDLGMLQQYLNGWDVELK